VPTYRNDSEAELYINGLDGHPKELEPGDTGVTYETYAVDGLTLISAAPYGNPAVKAASGPAAAVEFDEAWIGEHERYRFAIETSGTVTAGTLAVEVKAGVGGYRAVKDGSGQAVTVDMAGPQVMLLDGPVEAIKFTPADFDGDGYTVEVKGY